MWLEKKFMKKMTFSDDDKLDWYLKEKKLKQSNTTTISKVIWTYPVVDKPYCIELIKLLDWSIISDIRHETACIKSKNKFNR